MEDPFEINWDELHIVRKIGEGAFGVVYQVL